MSTAEKRGKKRPKSYYIKCAHKKAKRLHDLDAGMCGFLVTCNTHEKQAVREMYNILNEYADKKFGAEQIKQSESDASAAGSGSNEDSEEDLEKAMSREISEIKQVSTQERRFQNVDTKTKNCIFIKTTLEDPCLIAHDIFTDLVETQQQKTRYAIRMIPISATCKTNLKEIETTATKLFLPHFETPHGVGLKFTSVCKIRNNGSISRMTVLPALSKIIREMNPLHTLNHDEPDLVVVVEVIRNICCLSVVRDFFRYRKYNFHEAVRVGQSKENISMEEATINTESKETDDLPKKPLEDRKSEDSKIQSDEEMSKNSVNTSPACEVVDSVDSCLDSTSDSK